MIYGCPRTASVIANNYCTIAKLSKVHFDELCHKNTKLIPKFKEKIFHYDDNVKLFLEKALDSVEYMKNASVEAKHEILFKFKKINFEKGGYLYKINDIATKMYIIQAGTVEIEHKAEGEPFIIERLGRGCILKPQILPAG